jgi:hypothetical protein
MLVLTLLISVNAIALRSTKPGKGEGPPPLNEEIIPNPDGCDPEKDCDPQVVETCKQLWEDKLAECEANAEAWAGFCPAPKYTDPVSGELRDCKQGCCSEAMEDLHEGMEEEPCMMPCHECDMCHNDLTEEDWQKADGCFMEAEQSEACHACHECDWSDMQHCEEVCEPCYDGFQKCSPCSGTCDSCHHCWEEVHHMDEMPPAEHEYEEGPCDGPCAACDGCWMDEEMMKKSEECWEEKSNTPECSACHECDWMDPDHCDSICSTCWDMEAECDVCADTCESCNMCWEETHCEGSMMSDDPCSDPCSWCTSCYEEMTEADYEEAGKCHMENDETEECQACYAEDWSDPEASEAKCEPCYAKHDGCDKCMGECDACHGCYDDLHGDMDMSEMPMESEYVDGPCDGACSACDMCWGNTSTQDEAYACYEEKAAGVEACKECEECDWESDPAACEAKCEACYAEVAVCDPCKGDCDSCDDCWDSVSESHGPGPMDEMPMDMDSHEGHFCDTHGPDEYPCCAHQSRDEQDACLGKGKHFCDSHDPMEFPCCQKQSHDEQDECLTAAGVYADEDTGAFGAAEPELSMGDEEFHNVCHEPCVECDVCHSDPGSHEEYMSCTEYKSASEECMSCDSCDWADASSDCQSVCDKCWESYEECDVCRDACSPCDGCWDEQYPQESAVHSEEDPCMEPCMTCDMCWTDPDATSGMETCYAEKDQSQECQDCYACDWMANPGECEQTCAPCYDSFNDCQVCEDECHGCHMCHEDVHAPPPAGEFETMAVLFSSKTKRVQKKAPTQQCKLQQQSASRKSEVVAAARKHHLKSADSLMHTLFPKPQKRATKMRAMLQHLQRSSKSKDVRKRSGETLRALFSLKASKKAARHARALRQAKKALKSKSSKTQASARKASTALLKVARKAKRHSKVTAKQNVVRQLKRIREAQNGKTHTVVKKDLIKKGATRHAQHTDVRTKVMKLLYVHHRSPKKNGKKVLRSLFRMKSKLPSKVHHSKAMMTLKTQEAKKAKFVQMMFALAHSKKAKARGFARKAIHLVAHTKALKDVRRSTGKAKRAKVSHSKVGKDAKVGLLRKVMQ